MRALLLFLACLALAVPARAQIPSPIDPAVRASVDQAQAGLRAAVSGLHERSLGDGQLKARLATIAPIQSNLAAALALLTPRLQEVDARLAQLGPAPGPNQPPDAPETATNRKSLTRVHEALDAELKQARLLSVEASQISAAIVEQLHRNFSQRMWTRSRSILEPELWRDFAAALPDDFGRLVSIGQAEAVQFGQAATSGRLIGIVLSFLAALLVLAPGRLLLNRMGYRRAAAGPGGSRLRRSALALWLVVVATVTPLIAGWLVRSGLTGAGALTADCDQLVQLAIRVVTFAALLEGLGRALLSPGKPSWRLAPIPDDMVDRLAPFPGLIGAAAGLATLVAGVSAAVGASLATADAADCVTVLVELATLGAMLTAMAHVRGSRMGAPSPAGAADTPPRGESRLPWVLAALAAWLALGAALLAVLAGYLAMATFLTRETVWISAVLVMLFLSMRFTDDVFPALLSSASALGRLLRSAIGVSDSALEQIGVLLSGVGQLALLLLGWSAILAPFGASAGDIVSRITSTQAVFKMGQVSISPGLVLGGVGLFIVGLMITRVVRGWLEKTYLPKTNMDVGVRTSLAVAVSYAGMILAVLVTFAYLGLSFSQIALFASALSVGIGFGLQAIIGNFVSGLILLAERPVKVGDWIAIGDLEGDVKAINIRATEIEMMDRSKLIVPNSDLVSKTVRNVTHSGALGRVKIVLRVDGAADPAKVRDLLTARLRSHPDVVKDPAPAVYFTDVHDGALEFTAFAYVASARQAYRVRSELLFQIVPDLRDSGVGLASSNAVVNVALPDRPIEPNPQPVAPDVNAPKPA